ncbi:outer membrane protein assembly factor BamC [Piscinibacter sp. Jin2]|uniref:Outer membrane protein assembly factor BamC n=1 Tax=Aquariibacter lacus TaxID=2801332 RepID=A0A9X0XFR5_9BURK|nr:outer membrane protein assembly factor BamC [Piscinibacter lacus]MBL0720263.1 outer membrane protein assembly factor BamC [Piscinibacter lacus]
MHRRLSALRLAPLCLLIALGACSSINKTLEGDKVDYRGGGSKQVNLEIPPDLTQLQKDARYQPVDGSITASSLQGGSSVAGASREAAVAPSTLGTNRLMRDGNQRWLVTSMTPEQLWPLLQQFWQERGFELESEQRELGLMQTTWVENRAKIPQDFIRRALGSVIDGLYDSGERDAFRTRIERTGSGSEVYISHRGAIEVYVRSDQSQTAWQPRPSDPELEATMLSRLMIKLGGTEEQAKAQSVQVAAAPNAAQARARLLPGTPAAGIAVDEGFDRAWRRVGLALDRIGFTVEDRDRGQGVYFVRYVDTSDTTPKEPGFFRRLFGGGASPDNTPSRYRIVAERGAGNQTVLRVQTDKGEAAGSAAAKRILDLLVAELR